MPNTQKISDDIYKINADSNIYIIKSLKLVIDAGNRVYLNEIKDLFQEIIDLKEIKHVVFTHLHYDHIGCFDLFENASFYTSKEEIKDYEENEFGAVLNQEILLIFKDKIKLKDATELEDLGLKFYNTPGHTRGSICILYNKILFSGDTLFFNDVVGRTDLPTSVAPKLRKSLEKIKEIDYETLCPGHDY